MVMKDYVTAKERMTFKKRQLFKWFLYRKEV
jgi:hypothetical protein